MGNLEFNYLGKDYEAFRNQMINRIPAILPEWTDYQQSDPGITIIELLSYGLDVISYYQDRVANELYLPTAQLRQSVIDYTKPLGYRLREPLPSKTYVVFEITPGGEDLIIPQDFRVTTKAEPGEELVPFETVENLTIPAGADGLEQENGQYIYSVEVVNGITIPNETLGSSSGLPNQRFKLRYPSVIEITDKLIVEVDEGSGFTQWDLRDELFLETDLEKRRHFTVEVDADDYLWIKFGSGVDGKVPEVGTDNIRVSYRVGGGKDTNVGSNTITQIPVQLNRVKNVFNPEPSTGGTDRETTEEAKVRLPIILNTRRRAVTLRDFKELPLLVNGVLKSTAEKVDDDGLVVKVAIVPKEEFEPEDVLDRTDTFIEEVKLLGSVHETHLAEPLLLDLQMTVLIGEEYEQDVLFNLISDVIEDSFQAEYRDFNEHIRTFFIYNILSGINGVLNTNIEKMSVIPFVIEETIDNVNGEMVFSDQTSEPDNEEVGYWKITMTSDTGFDVVYDPSGEFIGSEVSKGSGTLGTSFTSSGNELSFLLTGSDLALGDYAILKAFPYKADIIIGERDIVLFGRLDLTIEGGLSSE